MHASSLSDSTAPFKIDEGKRPAASHEEFCGVRLKQALHSPPSVGDWSPVCHVLLLRGSLGRLQIRGTPGASHSALLVKDPRAKNFEINSLDKERLFY